MSFPIKHGDFPVRYVANYQRLLLLETSRPQFLAPGRSTLLSSCLSVAKLALRKVRGGGVVQSWGDLQVTGALPIRLLVGGLDRECVLFSIYI